VPDPVAVTVDPQGRVYVSATTRRKVADLDIREHTMWIPDDVSLTSVEEKEAFLKRELAPGKLRLPRGDLKDHNKDGSIDWKDLTVHSERIYQLRDTDNDGTADKMTVFAEGFNSVVTGIAAGILYHDGWVYVTVAPDLVRLRDTDDDGVADEREVVAHGFGMHIAYAGHDMHGPRMGPDGRIYWSIGDKGVNVTSKEGKRWYYPHEGCVMRCEPDGSGFEVFAHGLRNVQEIAFDDFGNMFGVDNDADMPGERERFVYITERSDSGWRCGHQYQKMESRWMRDGIWQPAHDGQPLFITPPLSNYSNGPAGFVHEPGTALGASLRGHFILDQFPSGQMTAFQIVPSWQQLRDEERAPHSRRHDGHRPDHGTDGRTHRGRLGRRLSARPKRRNLVRR
jgi:quinoprotein glucose dehydrogenase